MAGTGAVVWGETDNSRMEMVIACVGIRTESAGRGGTYITHFSAVAMLRSEGQHGHRALDAANQGSEEALTRT